MAGKVLVEDIVSGVKKGDKRSAARLMSMAEKAAPVAEECLKILLQGAKPSHVIGVTGWPGVGKSTLIGCLARTFLKRDKQVGIIAVDPTSPLSGGSFLGDRERMRGIDGDERLFIRSMATRGFPGGIAAATDTFVSIMEAMGKEVIIVETVGVGQDQVSVADVADTVVMTVIPGMGDYLQALKAGIMEVGDIFVVNKADRKGVDKVMADLAMIVGMNDRRDGWTPPILKTTAVNGGGVEELAAAVERHKDHFSARGLRSSRRASAMKLQIVEALKERSLYLINERTGLETRLDEYARQVLEGSIDRRTLADLILKEAGIIE